VDGSTVRERFLDINTPTHNCAFILRRCSDWDAGQIASSVLQIAGLTRPTESRGQSNRFSALVGYSAHWWATALILNILTPFSEFGAILVFNSGTVTCFCSDSLKLHGIWANMDNKLFSSLFFYKVCVTATVEISFKNVVHPFQFNPN